MHRFENMDELRPEEGSSSSAPASSGYSSASDDEVSNVDKRTGYRARKRIRSMISNVALDRHKKANDTTMKLLETRNKILLRKRQKVKMTYIFMIRIVTNCGNIQIQITRTVLYKQIIIKVNRNSPI